MTQPLSSSYESMSGDADWRFRQLLDALPVAVYGTDAEGRLTFYNEAAAGLAGRRPELGSDRWCVSWRLYWPDGSPMAHDACPMAMALKTGRPIRGVEGVVERPDGTRVPIMPYPTPLRDENGTVVGAMNMLIDLTDQKRSEEALQEFNSSLEQRVEERTRQMLAASDQLRGIEQRFRLLVESVTDYAIFMLDSNGIVVNWNSGAQRIKGYRADEIVGRHFSQFYTEEDQKNGLPMRALAVAAREGRYAAEGWRVRKSGERFWASVVIDPVYEAGNVVGFAKVTRDVTDRRIAEEALRESERMARGIIDTAIDAFIQTDEAGLVREWNKQAEVLFGRSRADVIGKPLWELITLPAQSATPRRVLERFMRTGGVPSGGVRIQLDAIGREGRMVTIELAVSAFQRAEGMVFNAFARDLTEKIATESRLRQAQKMEAIGQLTGGIAHDFNNLLAAILPSLELAKARVSDERVAKYLENAARAAGRGASLTRQLLGFARKQDLIVTEVDVNHLVAETCEMLPRTLGPTITVEMELAEGAWTAMMDASQLEGALLNLAINARDAMSQGGVLKIKTENVPARNAREVWQLDAKDHIGISVIDTGVGMSEVVRGRVFEPFFTTKEPGRGSGLGLSMVYGFIKQSGGNILIESEVGKGTTIRLFLPRAPVVRSVADAFVGHADPNGGEPSRLLVVDDDDDVREVTASIAQGLGHTTVDAASGQAALDVLKHDRDFDLMIVDLAMPQMDGMTFVAKARPLMPDTPVLFVTGFAERHFPQEMAKNHLLRKPFRQVQLAEKLREMLSRAESAIG